MRMIVLSLCLLCVQAFAQAPAPYPVTINSRSSELPGIWAERGMQQEYALTFADGATASDLSGKTVWMSWATNATATVCTTASVSIVTATSGTATATFSASSLNYTPGRYIYEVGTASNGVNRSYGKGYLTINGSPYGSGATTINWSSNLITLAVSAGKLYFTAPAGVTNIVFAFPSGTNWILDEVQRP